MVEDLKKQIFDLKLKQTLLNKQGKDLSVVEKHYVYWANKYGDDVLLKNLEDIKKYLS